MKIQLTAPQQKTVDELVSDVRSNLAPSKHADLNTSHTGYQSGAVGLHFLNVTGDVHRAILRSGFRHHTDPTSEGLEISVIIGSDGSLLNPAQRNEEKPRLI